MERLKRTISYLDEYAQERHDNYLIELIETLTRQVNWYVPKDELISRYSREFLKSGTHYKIVEANRLMQEAKRLEKECMQEEREEAKKLIPVYVTQVLVNDEEGIEHITFLQTLTNEEAFNTHLNYYGQSSVYPQNKIRSVSYYRMNQVLLHEHGGMLLLKDKVVCTDEQWEQLKSGDIPEELLRN